MIIVRRTLTEPNTAFAGVALEISFARFMASTAAFSKERASSRRFSRLELSASMVEGRGSWEKTVWRACSAKGSELADQRPLYCNCGTPRADCIRRQGILSESYAVD